MYRIHAYVYAQIDPPPNKHQSHLEAGDLPVSRENKRHVSNRGWVPPRGCDTCHMAIRGGGGVVLVVASAQTNADLQLLL